MTPRTDDDEAPLMTFPRPRLETRDGPSVRDGSASSEGLLVPALDSVSAVQPSVGWTPRSRRCVVARWTYFNCWQGEKDRTVLKSWRRLEEFSKKSSISKIARTGRKRMMGIYMPSLGCIAPRGLGASRRVDR